MTRWKCNRCNHDNTSSYRCEGCGINTKFHNPVPTKVSKSKLKRFGYKLTIQQPG